MDDQNLQADHTGERETEFAVGEELAVEGAAVFAAGIEYVESDLKSTFNPN